MISTDLYKFPSLSSVDAQDTSRDLQFSHLSEPRLTSRRSLRTAPTLRSNLARADPIRWRFSVPRTEGH